MLSGPVDLLFLAALMAAIVSSVVMVTLVLSSLRMSLVSFRYSGLVLCLLMLVNWLVKLSAFCLGVEDILLPNWIVILGGFGSFLLFSPLMVFQSLSVFCLWSQLSSRCVFHSSVLYVWMSLDICRLIWCSLKSLGSFCLMWSLFLICVLIWSGRICLFCFSLPLGM